MALMMTPPGASQTSSPAVSKQELAVAAKTELLIWVMVHRRIREQPFTVIPPLVDIYRDKAREICILKAAQVFVSEYCLNLAFWVADTRQGGRGNVLYVFPAKDQLGDFTRARVDTAIAESTHLMERVKPQKDLQSVKGADNVGLKRVGDGYLYFRGSNAESGLVSVDADLVIYDEVDRLRPGTLSLGAKRLGSSLLGWQRYASTPLFPEMGIDALWLRSDRRHYHLKCEHCNKWQAPGFPENVRPDGEVICRICQKPLDRLGAGEWVPEVPGADIHGYHMTKLLSPRADIKELARIGYGILNKDITDTLAQQQFYNQDLGVAWVPDDEQLVLVPSSAARRAEQATYDPGGVEVVACDVARQGSDWTVVYGRRGRVARLLWQIQGSNTMQTAGFLKEYHDRGHRFAHFVVDGVGVGAGVIDRLREQGIGVIEFQGGSGADDGAHYYNRNAEVGWRMRQAFFAGMDIDVNSRLFRDLTTRRYDIQSDRRIKLESKDELKKDGRPSPDHGDALAMTFVLDWQIEGEHMGPASDVGFTEREEESLEHESQLVGVSHGRGSDLAPYAASRWNGIRKGHRR